MKETIQSKQTESEVLNSAWSAYVDYQDSYYKTLDFERLHPNASFDADSKIAMQRHAIKKESDAAFEKYRGYVKELKTFNPDFSSINRMFYNLYEGMRRNSSNQFAYAA